MKTTGKIMARILLLMLLKRKRITSTLSVQDQEFSRNPHDGVITAWEGQINTKPGHTCSIPAKDTCTNVHPILPAHAMDFNPHLSLVWKCGNGMCDQKGAFEGCIQYEDSGKKHWEKAACVGGSIAHTRYRGSFFIKLSAKHLLRKMRAFDILCSAGAEYQYDGLCRHNVHTGQRGYLVK